MVVLRFHPVRRLALLVAVVLVLTMSAPPQWAMAVSLLGSSADGIRATVKLLQLPILGQNSGVTLNVGVPASPSAWPGSLTTQNPQTNVLNILGLGQLASAGVITLNANSPAGGGSHADASVANLNLLGAVTSVGAIKTSCDLTPSGISSFTDVAALKVSNLAVNPDVNVAVDVPGLLTATVDHRTLTWDSNTGLLTYRVGAVDVDLLNALSIIASGTVNIATSTCKGYVKYGNVVVDGATLSPGQSGTPTVTVSNIGEVGTPNTVITIPAPPSGYTLGTPTVTGGGTCTKNAAQVTTCSGVTVPAGGSVKVSLPVTLNANATGVAAANWASGTGGITVVSTPVAGAGGTISQTGTGTLVTASPPLSTGGALNVVPLQLQAGKNGTAKVTITNNGPSDAANTTITIARSALPTGVQVNSVKVGGNLCTGTSTITCPNVNVPAGGTVSVDFDVAAGPLTAVGSTVNVTTATATLNSSANLSTSGNLITITDPDVNLDSGVSFTGMDAVPGGPQVTQQVKVANVGATNATGTTITLPAAPAGYTVGPVTTSGGGTCTATGCTGVTVPAKGFVTVTIPVTLGPAVTAPWTGAVTSAGGGSSGTVSGTLITPKPSYALGISATAPPDGKVSPGQTTSMTVRVYDQGPSNAPGASFVVVAPPNTTFAQPTGVSTAVCPTQTSTTLTCATPLNAGDPGVTLTLPLTVSAAADTTQPITGGCVSTDGVAGCGGTDPSLPAFTLRTALETRLTVDTVPATITPGTTGTAKVRLTSAQDETGLNLTVPTTDLPAGFTPLSASVAGGPVCSIGPPITCTGISLTAGQPKDVSILISLGPTTQPATWTANGITVMSGVEKDVSDGKLATTTAPAARLTAVVTVPPDNTVEPGQTANVGMTITNQGPSAATNATVTVTPPIGTTFGTLTDPAAVALCPTRVGSVLTCKVTAGVGQSTSTVTLPVSVPASAGPDTKLTGGCVNTDGVAGCLGADDAVIPDIKLKWPFASRLTFAADPAAVTPGSNGTATLHVTAAHGALSGLTVTVPLSPIPAGVSVGPGATVTVGGVTTPCVVTTTVQCGPLSLADGQTADITMTVAATSDAPQGSWNPAITAAAAGASTQTSLDLADVGPPAYKLGATVTLPPATTLLPGGTSTLQVTVDNNNGPSDANNAKITVLAPAGAHFTALAPPTSSYCTVMLPDDTRAQCTLDLAYQQQVTLNLPIRIDASAPAGQPISGCVDLNSDGACTAASDRNIQITLGTPLSKRLTVVTDPAGIVPGDPTTSTATVTLTSTTAETGLAVTIPYTGKDGSITVGSATVPGSTCTWNGQIQCTGITLAANTPKVISIGMTAPPNAPQSTWTTSGMTAKTATETAAEAGDLATVLAPRTSITVTDGVPAAGTVSAGDDATFTVRVDNAGPSDSPTTKFTVKAPDGTTFVTVPSGCAITLPALATCSVNVPASVGPGPVLSFKVHIPDDADPFTPLGNGCVNLDGGDCKGPDDEVIDPIVLKVPLARRATVTTTPATVTPGASGTAQLKVTATNGALSGVTVVVPTGDLPGKMHVTAISGASCTPPPVSSTDWTCTIASIADKTTTVLSVTVTADPDAPTSLTWTAQGIKVSDASDSIQVDRPMATTGAPSYTLTPGATLSPATILPGGTGTYSVTVQHSGPSKASGVKYGVMVPAGVSFGTLPGNCVADPASSRRLICTDDFAPGATVTTSVPVQVSGTADPGAALAGGCVDINNDSYCATPPDFALPAITVGTPFDRQISITTQPGTIGSNSSGTAAVVVHSTTAQTLDVSIPLTGKPAEIGVSGATANNTPCTVTTTIDCDNITLAAPGDITVTLNVAVAQVSQPITWASSAITVTGANPGESVTGGGVLVHTSAPQYHLTATTTAQADDVVLPGGTGTITATIKNTGTDPAPSIPVTLRAPAGTTFGALSGTTLSLCPTRTPTTLTCTVTVPANNGTVGPLTLPIVVPSTAGGTIDGGCLDFNGDATCSTSAPDVALPKFVLRVPLPQVISEVPGAVETITPGRTATAEVDLSANALRPGLLVTIDTSDRPAGLVITTAKIGSTTCNVDNTANTITCTPVDFQGGKTLILALDLTAAPITAAKTWSPAVTIAEMAGSTVKDSTQLRPDVVTVNPPDATVTASVAVPPPGKVLAGDTAVVTVTLHNTGPSTKVGATYAFRAPANSTFTALTGDAAGYCQRASDVLVTCTLNVPPGDVVFDLGLKVADNADPGSTLGGGCIDNDGNNVCNGNDPVKITIQLGKTFADHVDLSVEGGTVVPGRTGTGRVLAVADQTFTNASLTIPTTGANALPAKMRVTNVTAGTGSQCTWTGKISCTAVTVQSGSHHVVTVTVAADPDIAAGVTWTPIVTLADSSGSPVQASGVLITSGAPESTITYAPAAVTGTVKPGDTVTMAVTVGNAGPSDATDVTTRVKAPDGTLFGSPPPAGCVAVGNTVFDCKFSLANGATVKWNLPIQVPASADPARPVTGGCVDKDRDGCGTGDITLPDIALTPTFVQAVTLSADPAEITPGRSGTVAVKVAATHVQNGISVTIPFDDLPPGMTVTGARAGSGTCVLGTGDVTCSGLSVPAGGATLITLDVAVKPAAHPGDGWSPAITATDGKQTLHKRLTNAAVIGAADIAVTAEVADVPSAGTVHAGGTGTIGVKLTNGGTSFAGAQQFSIVAPDGVTFPAQTGTTGQMCAKVSDIRLDCTVDVGGNARTQFPITFEAAAGADPAKPLTGGCVRTGLGSDCRSSDAPIPDIQLFRPAADTIVVTGAPDHPAPGANGTGGVVVTSPTKITGATVTVPLTGLPAGFTYVGASGPTGSQCSKTATEVKCTGVTVESGGDTPVKITVRTPANATSSVTWRPTVTVVAGNATVTGTADLITPGAPVAPVSFTVTGPSGSVAPGDTTTLRISVANAGPSVATGRTATINAPTHTKFGALSGQVAKDCTRTSDTQLNCTYDVDPATSLEWVVPLEVDGDAQDGDTLSDGCVSAGTDKTCGDPADVAVGDTPVDQPLSRTGAVQLGTVVAKPGEPATTSVTISATVDHDNLTLTVPLSALPTGIKVTGASMADASCTVTSTQIRCTGVDLAADTPRTLTIDVAVGSGVSAGTAWKATGIVLADADDATDRLTASGTLVTTDTPAYTVSVTIGSPSPAKPASGDTAVLPIHIVNSGPGDAKPYEMVVVVPPGTKHGTLPAGCVEGAKASIVICKVTVPAGESVNLEVPIVVDDDAKPGDQVSDGCLDGALATGTPKFDYTCGGDDDVAIPGFEVGRHAVNLAISYGGATVPIKLGEDGLVVKVPYANDGTLIADNVAFTIAPPEDVWVAKATVLIDDSNAEVQALAAETTMVDTTCTGVASGAANEVACEAPDSAALSGSELWLTLKVGSGAKAGTHLMRVTVSTSSADGNTSDNAVDIPLVLAAASDNGTNPDNDGSSGSGGDTSGTGGGTNNAGGRLAKTGAQITGLALLSMIMMVVGFTTVTLARERGLRPGTATRARAGSHASAEGIAEAFRGALRVGRTRRPPRHARSAPARRHRCGE
ncbi:hypothetical protein HH310_30355 [Actinoplanes sp. TBRC 11911]|uniref:DUF11 domain-containing protein n=1 Tax=Actinoplanes sp. TBRC 11911 TaxID=2729386 RepID=UPI00145FAF92|nr:DUF11 domain-containing protein [Actinoplanes sp. TBRC 11911]NMO55473.1 hypothetical protein [Actinoplanes sp. TBRC 11911]